MKKVYIQPVVDTNDFATVSMLCGSPFAPKGMPKGDPLGEYEVMGD